MVSGFFGLSKVEIHLCGSVNAKKIVVVVRGGPSDRGIGNSRGGGR